MSPMTAFLTLQGVETLSLRMQRHADNALAVAAFLEDHPAISEVNYPSLPSGPQHNLAAKYFPRGSGAILGVRVSGGLAAAKQVLAKVRIFDYNRRSAAAMPLGGRSLGAVVDVFPRDGGGVVGALRFVCAMRVAMATVADEMHDQHDGGGADEEESCRDTHCCRLPSLACIILSEYGRSR